eukprot:4006493-Pleurochrysis_carterae.AAC.1
MSTSTSAWDSINLRAMRRGLQPMCIRHLVGAEDGRHTALHTPTRARLARLDWIGLDSIGFGPECARGRLDKHVVRQ